ncbi:unnamed protein product [Penicillium salamii]|uniref:AAA+ ATPase domain-containing protein n=1 Tax=Penicillium salamii TaxID=1612424 RepID=A0A9W4JWX8_9EURO|nr:unnamed protein product [Penicillium salamii]
MSLATKRKPSPEATNHNPKAQKTSPHLFEHSDSLIIYRVLCCSENHHFDHPNQVDFFDVPRLFLGDSKASNLRGNNPIRDTEKYLKEHTEISLYRIKVYSCDAYHDSIQGQFQTLRAPLHPMSPEMLRFFYILDEDGHEADHESEDIIILCKDLQQEIGKVINTQPKRISTTDGSVQRETVVNRLYSHLRRGDSLDARSDSQMARFFAIMEAVFKNDYGVADGLFSNGYVSGNHLAKLFRPNETIVTNHGGHPRAYTLDSWPEWRSDSLILPCATWSFDGQFYRETEEIEIAWPLEDGEMPIATLSAYPLRFDEKMEQRLINRGGTFWRYSVGQYVSYVPSLPAVETNASKLRYMIDSKTFQHVHSTAIEANTRVYLSKDAHSAECPPDQQFQILLPATIPGFGFHDKKWISLSVENIQEITWNEEAFKHLVLKSTKKELIKALVAKHTAAGDSNDVIEGKGNGLILLLHGGPGTGKTLTAESVAELTRRPLYRVTCGDIGTNAEEVERYLESVLYLGTIWQCVVLLDEADVFLEERTQQDLQRNALVSVFLRVLEYYSGILILTSNRIGTFDEAFKSRVQLTLHYPDLDESSRRRIWSNFITRIHHTNPHAKADQILEKIDELAKFELNGREIRNNLRTSILLAEFRGHPLQYSHLMDVIDVSNEFMQYLRDIHGHTASEWAKSQRIRQV